MKIMELIEIQVAFNFQLKETLVCYNIYLLMWLCLCVLENNLVLGYVWHAFCQAKTKP